VVSAGRHYSGRQVQDVAGRRNAMISTMKHKHLITFASVMVVAWAVGTFLFIYSWPHLVNNTFKRAIVEQGFGDGPVPINTLYTELPKLFAEPLAAQSACSSNLMSVGVNHDTRLTVGWFDLNKGPQVLPVPDFSGRYYSVQFTDPFEVDFAHVGTRTTGAQADDYLIKNPWAKENQNPRGLELYLPPFSKIGIGMRQPRWSEQAKRWASSRPVS